MFRMPKIVWINSALLDIYYDWRIYKVLVNLAITDELAFNQSKRINSPKLRDCITRAACRIKISVGY